MRPTRQSDYHRNLPHYLPNDAPYFVTTRLAGSIPSTEIARLNLLRGTVPENRFFAAFDESLRALHDGIDYLRHPRILDLLLKKLFELEQEKHLVEYHAFCIMPNHIHLVLDVIASDVPLFDIMKLLKGATAYSANKILNRRGKHFWQFENYDHVVRRGSLERIIRYVLLNPVKAGLVMRWQDWPGTYLAARYSGDLIIGPN